MIDRAEQMAEDSKIIMQYMNENMPPLEVALAMRRMMTANSVMMIEAEPYDDFAERDYALQLEERAPGQHNPGMRKTPGIY